MNIIQWFVRLLSGDKTKQKIPEQQPVPKDVENPPPENGPKPERVSFSDDSPPGYKIRWHH